MPNLAFHLEVLNQAIKQLVTDGDARGALMAQHKKFAALGAMGPDLLRYVPINQGLADALDQLMSQPLVQGQILPLTDQQLIAVSRNPLGAIYSVLFRQLVIPVWPVVDKFKSFLDTMDAIAQAEDLPALLAMWGPANSMQSEVTSLQGKVAVAEKVAVIMGGIIFLASPWMEQAFISNLAKPVDNPTYNRPFEFLRWHQTGNFALELLNQATDVRHRAFAYGYLSHVSSSVIGENFVNKITGGPYRTHGWRNRLVTNFIDSWTYGYFNSAAQMNGDEPSPPYASWKPLCSANIQAEFDIADLTQPKSHDVPAAVKALASGDLGNLPNQFPDGLAQLLLDTVTAIYPSQQPMDGFTKNTFKQAYVGAFAVYWFMTSGSGPMCNNPLGPPPANCQSAPAWIASGAAPTPQQAGLNVGGTTCAVLLAIAALLLILTGALVLGVIALILAMNAPIVDWDKVRCNLFWLRKTLVDIENALRDMLVRSGLAYPPPQKLGTIDTNGNTQPASDDTISNAVPFCRATNQAGGYPKGRDDIDQYADLNFSSYPVKPGAEVPTSKTQTLINPSPSGPYPDFVVNGTAKLGPNNSILTDGNEFPRSQKISFGDVFGDAVANAVDLIVKDGVGLQNYNLDADRGYGWKTWKYYFDPNDPNNPNNWSLSNFATEAE
jgi:hypothetical protein